MHPWGMAVSLVHSCEILENPPDSNRTGAIADAPYDEDDAIAAEAAHFRQLKAELEELHPEESNLRSFPIGLALSGGGTRAAAFHCGVFWSLASSGLIKNIEHISAVSGAGYTAASYISHICHAAQEAQGDDGASSALPLKEWYQRVVAQFVLRMQHNISYLVATVPERWFRFAREDLPEESGSSCCPRIVDAFLLTSCLIGSVTASPLLLILQTLWPIVMSIELWHGAMLRSAWCHPNIIPTENSNVTRWLWESIGLILVLAVIVFILAMLSNAYKPTLESHSCYLYTRSFKHIVERGAICYGIYVLMVVFVLSQQRIVWSSAEARTVEGTWVRALCHHYIRGEGFLPTCSDFSSAYGQPWYKNEELHLYFNQTWVTANTVLPNAPAWDFGHPLPIRGSIRLDSMFVFFRSPLGASGMALVVVAAFIWRIAILKWLLTIAGPCVCFLVVSHVARWAVFGPITSQMMFPTLPASRYHPDRLQALLWICVAGALLTLPVYDAIQKLAHLYYRRSLKRAFFKHGRDLDFDVIANTPYCPNLMFGACVHDYRKPWEEPNHGDFTLSSLFIGCRRTGFFCTPSNASLARLMTIAGAGTDAAFLLTADIPAIRFLLAVVALRFGDFLRLQPEGPRCMRLEGRIVNSLEGQQLGRRGRRVVARVLEQHWISAWMQGFLDRMPAACPFLVAHIMLLAGAIVGLKQQPTDRGCQGYAALVNISMLIFAAICGLSFFGYVKSLQWLMRSPMIQQLLLLFMHRYKAVEPPPYLYISDGGLIEVLGIVPLLRRRLSRIIVSDAADDPDLSMRCLRDAFSFCRQEGICSFYDPREPRRDLEFILQDFRCSSEAVLHLGIRYETHNAGNNGNPVQGHGELFYVRMRLVPGDNVHVRNLLSESELLQKPQHSSAAAPHIGEYEGLRRDMGGTVCPASECGGFCAGRRFPNFGMSNQFLTPVHFANLCNLGADLCEPLINAVLESLQHADSPL